jgi:DNA-binding MarR family transcriptional regulator
LYYHYLIENITFVRYGRKKRKVITVYLDTQESILLKSKDKTFHVLYYILRQTDMETHIWYSDKIHKQNIMDKLGISPVTLDKHISSLKQRELIITTSVRGRYRLNMQIFST